MTIDEGCRGASNSLFVVQREEREYEYAERRTFFNLPDRPDDT